MPIPSSTAMYPIPAPARWATSPPPAPKAGPRRGGAARCACRTSMRWGWARRCGWPRAPRCRGSPPRPPGAGARRQRCRAARTRRRGIGNWRASRCPGTGTISPIPSPPSRKTCWMRWRGFAARAERWATAMPRASRSSRNIAPSTCGPAGRSATPPPTASFRLPAMRKASASTGSCSYVRTSPPGCTR